MTSYLPSPLRPRRIRKYQRAVLGCLLMLIAGLAQTGAWNQVFAMGQAGAFVPDAALCTDADRGHPANDGSEVLLLCPLCGVAAALDVPGPALASFGSGDWIFSDILPRKHFSMPGRQAIGIRPLQPRAPPGPV